MIRAFQIGDLDVVMEIWLDANIHAHSFIEKNYWTEHIALVKEVLPQATVGVYEEAGRICGFIGMNDDYIAGIFVARDRQSNGIGKKLLAWAKAMRNKISLTVYEKNERAVLFYLREGFNVVEKSADDVTGESEITMEWSSE